MSPILPFFHLFMLDSKAMPQIKGGLISALENGKGGLKGKGSFQKTA